MPDGNLICGYEKSEDKKTHKLIFWEKNGLRHGEFDLPDYLSEY